MKDVFMVQLLKAAEAAHECAAILEHGQRWVHVIPKGTVL